MASDDAARARQLAARAPARAAGRARARAVAGARRAGRRATAASPGDSARGFGVRRADDRGRTAAAARAASPAASLSSRTETTATSGRPRQLGAQRRRPARPMPAGLWAPSRMTSTRRARVDDLRSGPGRASTAAAARDRAPASSSRRGRPAAAARASAKFARWKAPRASSAHVAGGRRLDEPGAALGGDARRPRPRASGCRPAPTTSVAPGAHDVELLARDVGDRRPEPARVLEADVRQHARPARG